jgi:hypothetical protein
MITLATNSKCVLAISPKAAESYTPSESRPCIEIRIHTYGPSLNPTETAPSNF